MAQTIGANKENGRSMVEILGVLAVVGVLSVGALAGYVYGMDKYRANEVLNSVSQMAIIGAQQKTLNPTVPINLSEFRNKTIYPFTTEVTGVSGDQFAIKFYNIPEGTCKRLLSGSRDFTAATDIRLNSVKISAPSAACVQSATNSFTYYFDKTIAGNDESGTGDGSGGGEVTPSATCTDESTQKCCEEALHHWDSTNSKCCESGGYHWDSANSMCCELEDDMEWDEDSGTCKDTRPLYVTTTCDGSHYDFTYGTSTCECPIGYEWASVIDFKEDFHCGDWAMGASCDSFLFNGWLKECVNSRTGAIISCSYSYAVEAFAVTLAHLTYGIRSYSGPDNPAVCRRK